MRFVTVHPPENLDVDRILKYDNLDTPFFTITTINGEKRLSLPKAPSIINASDKEEVKRALQKYMTPATLAILEGYQGRKVLYEQQSIIPEIPHDFTRYIRNDDKKVYYRFIQKNNAYTIIYHDEINKIFIEYYTTRKEEPEIIKYAIDGDYDGLVNCILPGARWEHTRYVSFFRGSNGATDVQVTYAPKRKEMKLGIELFNDYVIVTGVATDDGVYEVKVPKTNTIDIYSGNIPDCNNCRAKKLIDHAGVKFKRLSVYYPDVDILAASYRFKWGSARILYNFDTGKKEFQVYNKRKWFTIPEAVFYIKLPQIKSIYELRALLAML